MRKLGLCLFSCMALVAFMGLSAPALADHVYDPDCEQYNHEVAIFDFAVTTPDSNFGDEVSGITGSGLVCGSRIHNGWPWEHIGAETLYERADVVNPPGVQVHEAPSDDLPDDSYAGSANVDILSWASGTYPLFVPDQDAAMEVDTPGAGTDCPTGARACYKGVTSGLVSGHNWNWVTQNQQGRYTLTIGPFYNDTTGEPAGLTEINSFSLCGYAGAVGGNSCGDGSDPSKWMQKNGSRSVVSPIGPGSPACGNGNGIYTVTATNYAGQTTPAATACVPWVRPATRVLPTQGQGPNGSPDYAVRP